jgi:hypothetical protein
MSAIFTIGKSSETSLPVHVRNAKNGLNSNCVCYECTEKLEAVQGSRDWYFRHYNKSNCPGSNETALHEFAKQVLFENSSIATHKKQIIYSETKKETIIGVFRSDVSAKYQDQVLHFEIVVNHDLTLLKTEYYRTNKINCIKIDLSDTALLKSGPEEIKKEVLENKINKHFIQWNEDKVNADVSTSSDNNSWLVAISIFLGSLFLFRKSLFSSSNKRRKNRR